MGLPARGASAWDELVGVIESSPRLARVSGRSGSWTVRSQRQRRGLVFTPSDVDGAMASYYPRRLLPGGTLALYEERWFKLRPPGLFGKAWKLSDAEAGSSRGSRSVGAGLRRVGSYVSKGVPPASLRPCSSCWRPATRSSPTGHSGHCRPARTNYFETACSLPGVAGRRYSSCRLTKAIPGGLASGRPQRSQARAAAKTRAKVQSSPVINAARAVSEPAEQRREALALVAALDRGCLLTWRSSAFRQGAIDLRQPADRPTRRSADRTGSLRWRGGGVRPGRAIALASVAESAVLLSALRRGLTEAGTCSLGG